MAVAIVLFWSCGVNVCLPNMVLLLFPLFILRNDENKRQEFASRSVAKTVKAGKLWLEIQWLSSLIQSICF